jgi:predicted membrane protein
MRYSKNNIENYKENNEGSKIAGGIIIVAIGVALLLRNMGLPLPHWLFTWPMILIMVGIYSGFKHNFQSNSWLIVTGIGVFFLIKRYIPFLHLEPLFWPLIIIAIGVVYILNPSKNWTNTEKKIEDKETDTTTPNTWQGFGNNQSADINDEFKVTSIFSGVKRSIITKNFKRGQVTSIFGGAEINMSQADMQQPSMLKLDVAFGGVEIIVPSNWVVQNDIQGIFHGVEDKRYNNVGTIDPNKVLVLKGSCAFGGIEIKSY